MTSIKLEKYTHQISVFDSENLFLNSRGKIVYCNMTLPNEEVERYGLSPISVACISEGYNQVRVLIFSKKHKVSLRDLLSVAWIGDYRMPTLPHELLIDYDAMDYSFVGGLVEFIKDKFPDLSVGLSKVYTHKPIKEQAASVLNAACKEIISKNTKIKSFKHMRSEIISIVSRPKYNYSIMSDIDWHEKPINFDAMALLTEAPVYYFASSGDSLTKNLDFKLPPDVVSGLESISPVLSEIKIIFRHLSESDISENKLIKSPREHWLSVFLSCITDSYKNNLIQSMSKELCVLFISGKCAIPMIYAQNLRVEMARQHSFMVINSVKGLTTCMDCIDIVFYDVTHFSFYDGKQLGFHGFMVFRKNGVFSVFMIKSEAAMKFAVKRVSLTMALVLTNDKIEVMTKLLRLYEAVMAAEDIDQLFFAVECLLDGASNAELDDILSKQHRDINLSLAANSEVDDTTKKKELVYDISQILHFGSLTNSDLVKIEEFVRRVHLSRNKEN